MDIVRAFNSNNLHTNIVIKGSNEEPLFRASDIGEVLEFSNIRSIIQNYNDSEKKILNVETLGGNQDITFLTEKGLYKILFKSRKPIAETFQNWVCDVIKEIRLNGVYDLKKQLEDVNKNVDKKLLEEKKIQKQELLLKQFNYNKSIVYIIKVKTYDNGEYVVKIGESRNGVESRYNEHKKNYEECLLLDCYEVNKSKQFEYFLHHHDKIRPNKVRNLPNHEKENELFKIDNKLTYMQLTKIITDNINTFNEWKVNDIVEIIREENKNLLEKLIKSNIQINATVTNTQTPSNDIIQKLMDKVEQLEKTNKELLEKLNKPQIKTTTNFNTELVNLGPRVQQINPETGALVKVYESAAECMKENNHKIKRQSLVNAINYNTIYCGYRWMYVNRESDPNIIINYQPTKITRPQNLGYVAKLDVNKTKILNVYLDRKTAAKENGYESASALDEPVKKGKARDGYFYMLYDNCDENLREIFEEEHGEPILYKDGIGQYDSDNNILQEFICKYFCIKNLHISEKSLNKAINNNIMYDNHYYRKIGSKVKMI